MKKIMILAGSAAVILSIAACGSSSGGGSGTASLTTAGKMTAGIAGSVTTMQNIGGAMGGAGTFSVGALAASTKCTAHADPGYDGNNGQPVDGVVSDMEKYNSSDVHYPLQKFYCALAAQTDGPESVSGAINGIKSIVCSLENQLGGLPFDGSTTTISKITFDTRCLSLDEIEDMTGSRTSPVDFNIPGGGATVTSAINPTFTEASGNVHYSHGIRIASVSPGALNYVILAKFDPTVSNPIESGEFEFATYGSGTMMQGTGIEYTAGKISGGAAVTKHLWFESRVNRVKIGSSDPVCQPGDPTASSCGFARHTRLSTDISFSGGDISGISNLSGVISDSGDNNESGNFNHIEVVTINGSLSTGLTGQFRNKLVSPTTLTSETILNAFSGGGTVGAKTCILGAGGSVLTGSPACDSAPAVLAPTGAIKTFLLPPNTGAWFTSISAGNGLGYTGTTTMADGQFAP